MFKFYSNKDLDTLTFKNFHTGLQSNFLVHFIWQSSPQV